MGLLSNFAQGALGYGVKYLEQEQEREDKMADAQKLAEFKAQIDARAEALKMKLKQQSEEEAQQRDARTKIAADDLGAKNLEEAQFQKFKKDLGQSDASDEELRKVFSDQYFDRSVAPGDANSQRYDPRDSEFIRAGRDAALKTGASSGLLKQYGEDLKLQQTAERDAEKLAFDREREDRKDERQFAMFAQQNSLADKRQAAMAARSGGGSGGGSGAPKVRSTREDAQGNVIAIMSDGSTKELGIKTGTFEKRVADLIGKKEKDDLMFKRLSDAEKMEWAIGRLGQEPSEKPQNPSPKKPDNTDTKSSTGGAVRVTSKAQFDALPKGALYVNPADGKTYRKN